jgi:surface polysaccharide O-acyltransferase-like enzyme
MNNSPSPIKKVRDSNMELLRIVAMLLVLIYHTNFLSFGAPTHTETIALPLTVLLRDFLNACSVICVNLFVFISGWYGIKPKIKRFAEFLFQISFIIAVTLILYSLLTDHKFDRHDFQAIFLMTDEMWFVKAYIILYLFAPALNAFIEKTSQRQLLITLIAFFVFQTIYGWAFVVVKWINDGYSPICFFGLYLLAGYIRKYKNRFTSMPVSYDLLTFTGLIIINTIIAYLTIYKGFNAYMWLNSYASPLVILETVYLALFFSKLSFRNNFINWVASSCFAVYLVHCSRNVLGTYCNTITSMHDQHSTALFLIYVSIFVMSVFAVSILLDKFRIIVWKKILKLLHI